MGGQQISWCRTYGRVVSGNRKTLLYISGLFTLHIVLAQADLKARAREMDERKEEEERLKRGEPSAIETIYSDEVNKVLQCLFFGDWHVVHAGFSLASRQGALAERKWWDWGGA